MDLKSSYISNSTRHLYEFSGELTDLNIKSDYKEASTEKPD